MENFTRIPESIRKDKSLTSTEKLLLSYLFTYQNKLVNGQEVPSKNYFFDTQENLAEELGTSISTTKRAIAHLEELGLIFTKPKGSVDGKPQYKNRLAIIMVDEHNELVVKPKRLKKNIKKTSPTTEPILIEAPKVIQEESNDDFIATIKNDIKEATIEELKAEHESNQDIVESPIINEVSIDNINKELKDVIKNALDRGLITIDQSNKIGHLIDTNYISTVEGVEAEIKDYNLENKKQ